MILEIFQKSFLYKYFVSHEDTFQLLTTHLLLNRLNFHDPNICYNILLMFEEYQFYLS